MNGNTRFKSEYQVPLFFIPESMREANKQNIINLLVRAQSGKLVLGKMHPSLHNLMDGEACALMHPT